MKKIYQNMVLILFIGLIGISSYAQGTWKATGTEPSINPSTAISMGITGISCMHSDAALVIGKPDAGAPTVTYNSITWDNESFIQGNTNGMYYAFRPTSSGNLDISVKMGSAKNTFVLELTSACPNHDNITALTTNFGTAADITGQATYFTLPQVYDTHNNTTNTWDGTAAMQSTGSNVYLVMSFPVTANKTYVVGCFGSKLMMRGVNFSTSSKAPEVKINNGMKITPNPARGSVVINIEETSQIGIYSINGKLIKQQLVSPLNKTVDISGLTSGIYYIKDLNNKSKTQKLVVK